MKKYLGLGLLLLGISSCMDQKVSSDKVFSNAQILYQDREENPGSKRSALEMPSYFLEMEYDAKQTKLNPTQIKKIEKLFTKLIYPEEYKLYVSFGARTKGSQMADLSKVFKRAQDIKVRYGKRVKQLKIVYLKNQKPNCVYLRLLG